MARDPAEVHEANRCLVELGDRPDLPEAEVLRRTVELRLKGGRLSADDVDRLVDGLPDVPQSLLLRAEVWYQFARYATGSTPGSWQTCLELTSRCLKAGLRVPEHQMALVVRAVARLMLGVEPDAAPGGHAPTTVTGAWLAGLRLVAQSIRTPRFRAAASARPKLPEAEISILRREDAALVRIAVAHAASQPAVRADFDAVGGWGHDQFFAIHLLRARQARLQGDDLVARAEYNRVFQEARDRGPDFLLDVEAGERST
jgi:hypothetical protein